MRQDLKVQTVSPQHQAATKCLFSILAFCFLLSSLESISTYVQPSFGEFTRRFGGISFTGFILSRTYAFSSISSSSDLRLCFLLELYLLCVEQTRKHQLNVYLTQCASILESIKSRSDVCLLLVDM